MNGRPPSRALGIALALVGRSILAYAADTPPDDPSLITLRSVVIDTRQAAPASLFAQADEAGAGAGGYALVKFPGPITAEQYQALKASVDRIYTYLPQFAFLVKLREPGLSPGSSSSLTAGTGSIGAVSWVGPYLPAYKMSPSIASVRADATDAAAVDTVANDATGGAQGAALQPVLLQVFPDADLARVTAAVRALGVTRIAGAQAGGAFSRLRLLLTPAEIVALREALARVPEVFWIEAEPHRVLLNDTTIWVGQSGLNAGQTTPVFDQGIFGEGQVVAVLDTGIDADMCYFRDPAPGRGLPPRNECNGGTVIDANQRKVLAVDFLWTTECAGGIAANEWDTQDHGSHVAGTVAGDNFLNPLLHNPGDGMAPGAKLVIQDAGFQTDNCADLPGLGCPVVDLKPIFQQAYSQGARIHTNSWGDRENFTPQNTYTAGSQDADQFMWDHKDFLLFFAAGNSGPGTGTVGSPSTAKNVVAVGATQRATAAGSIAGFSSCGPTDDGRLKPDLTVPGVNIVSANNDLSVTTNNCVTKTSSGTSMASPGGAGLAALVRQYFTQGWYPSGAPNAANAFVPSAALLKAAMVNSAVNMTGVAAPIPSNCQGWGRVLLEQVLHFNGQRRRLFVQDDAIGFARGSVGETRTFRFTVNSNAESFKATLAWTDFPSTPAANPHLNDDLDLVVTGPGGTFRGNVFAAGQSTTGGAADRRNTVEQVLIATPAPGEYTVTVQSFNVPDGPQPFALVVTGDLTPCGTTCGGGAVTVFADDFEMDRGWTPNPSTTDTATTGRWERGDPEPTDSSGPKQLGNANSGVNDLVTGRTAGASAGVNDIDGGTTSIRSPAITLPATGNLTLSFAFYFAHGTNSSSADFFRVSIVGATTTMVFQELGSTADDDAAWQTTSVSLNAFAGQTIRILVEAADAAGASLVEAAVDDVRIVQQ